MSGREFSPMKMAHPNPKTIKCKNCKYRDKTTVEIDGEIIDVGITKGRCEKYLDYPYDMGKPSAILFQNADCEYYEKE